MIDKTTIISTPAYCHRTSQTVQLISLNGDEKTATWCSKGRSVFEGDVPGWGLLWASWWYSRDKGLIDPHDPQWHK